MPLAPLLTVSLDKGMGADPLGQSTLEHRNDFFDQYLNFDTVSVDGSLYLTAPESTLLVSAAKGSDFAGTSIKLLKDEAGQDLPPHERGEPHRDKSAASKNDKPDGNTFCFQDSCRAAGTEIELLSLEKISLQSPRLKSPPPSSELLVNRKTRARQERILDGFHKHFQKESDIHSIRKSTSPIRKATSPSKMRRTQYTDQNIHDWGQRATSNTPKFDFGFQNTGTLSPPSSSRASESSDNNNRMMGTLGQSDGAYAWDNTVTEQYAYREEEEEAESPLTTPPGDIGSFHQSNMQNANSNNMMYANPNQHQSSAQWVQTSINQDYSYEASTAYGDDQDPPIWWANTATTPLTEPVPSAYRRHNQPNNQNLAMQLQAELTYNANELSLNSSNMPTGLMIQMPNSPAGPYVVDATPVDQEQGYFASTGAALQPPQPQQHHRYSQSQAQNYAPLPATRHEKSHSHSHSHSQPRKDASPSPRPRASSRHSSKKHSSSRKRAADSQTGGQKSSKGGGSSPGLVADFVNFTPSDKARILTGVAPSGSSKTKARREKEAAEKTKRLSQAAVRAVQAAGGSIDTLVEEGLFDGPELEEMS